MAADNWAIYDHVAEIAFDGTLDFDTDTFRCVLVTSGYTPATTHTQWSSASGSEHSNANGYSTHGVAVASPTMTQASGVGKWDTATDPTWTASGGSITARYAVIVRDANGDNALASTDLLIAYSLLDDTPADVTATDGNTLTIALAADGIIKTTLS